MAECMVISFSIYLHHICFEKNTSCYECMSPQPHIRMDLTSHRFISLLSQSLCPYSVSFSLSSLCLGLSLLRSTWKLTSAVEPWRSWVVVEVAFVVEVRGHRCCWVTVVVAWLRWLCFVLGTSISHCGW